MTVVDLDPHSSEAMCVCVCVCHHVTLERVPLCNSLHPSRSVMTDIVVKWFHYGDWMLPQLTLTSEDKCFYKGKEAHC